MTTKAKKAIRRNRIMAAIHFCISIFSFTYGLMDLYHTRETVTETFVLCAVIFLYALGRTCHHDDRANKLVSFYKGN